MIVSIVSLKGGVGKTTTTLYLAQSAFEAGRHPHVLDADEEASALSWAALAEERGQPLPFPVVRAEKNTMAKQARALETNDAVVIIDTPPNNREALSLAAMVSDIVVVPVSPSGVDVDRLVNTLALLSNVEAARGSMTQAVLLTRYDARQTLAREAAEALKELSVFETKIRNLARYQSFGGVPSYLEEYAQAWTEISEAVS
jgi:chromosome partitioning protein